MARRAADLAAAAEAAANGRHLTYVIGTEVPTPGGETALVHVPTHGVQITTALSAQETLALHRDAFAARGVGHVMAQVIAMVVQPGVDFGNAEILPFDPPAASELCGIIPALGGPLFEAHSTDYQDAHALRALVKGHFAILKVGPELTFAYRQAVFALERLAHQMGIPAGVEAALRQAMADDPRNWRSHVALGPDEGLMMIWGLSDRVRYYWAKPGVQAAQQALFATLRAAHPPPGLVAQVTGGLVAPTDPQRLPETIIQTMVGAVVARYRTATGDYDAP
jgi:D-tagatose-1,6-bisphosphate aldolase subunit GatZ/KbaZ